MLTSITPLGERSRNRNWIGTASAYVAGSVAGGIASGGIAGALGALVPPALRADQPGVLIAGILAVAALGELGVIKIPQLPRRQVNEDWLEEYRGWVTGLGFGFQLGLGVATIVTSLAVPATFIIAFVIHSPAWGALIGATFGLARALPILRARRVADTAALARLHRNHDRAARPVSRWVALAAVPLAVLVMVV